MYNYTFYVIYYFRRACKIYFHDTTALSNFSSCNRKLRFY